MKLITGSYYEIEEKEIDINQVTKHIWYDEYTTALLQKQQNYVDLDLWAIPILEGFEQYYNQDDIDNAVYFDNSWQVQINII